MRKSCARFCTHRTVGIHTVTSNLGPKNRTESEQTKASKHPLRGQATEDANRDSSASFEGAQGATHDTVCAHCGVELSAFLVSGLPAIAMWCARPCSVRTGRNAIQPRARPCAARPAACQVAAHGRAPIPRGGSNGGGTGWVVGDTGCGRVGVASPSVRAGIRCARARHPGFQQTEPLAHAVCTAYVAVVWRV